MITQTKMLNKQLWELVAKILRQILKLPFADLSDAKTIEKIWK